MSKELYNSVVDEKINNALNILFNIRQQNMLINLITLLITINVWDEYEETILSNVLIKDSEETTIADNIIDIITTGVKDVLIERGVKVYDYDLSVINSFVITFNELISIDNDSAGIILEYFDISETDEEFILALIVEHYSELDVMTVYDSIKYVTPTLMNKIKDSLTSIIDNGDTDDITTNIIDPIVTRSRIYNLLLPTEKLEGNILMENYYNIFNTNNNINVLANELYVVIKYTKNIENSMYYLTSEIEDDLLSLVSGDTTGTTKVHEVIARTKILIKDL